MLHLENMMLEHDDDLVAALDLGSAMTDERRHQVLSRVTGSLATYVTARGTVERLRASYVAGELRSAFIRAATRGVLERFAGDDDGQAHGHSSGEEVRP